MRLVRIGGTRGLRLSCCCWSRIALFLGTLPSTLCARVTTRRCDSFGGVLVPCRLETSNFVSCRFNGMIFDSSNSRLSKTGINSQICLVVCMLAVACCFSPARGFTVRFSGSLPSLVEITPEHHASQTCAQMQKSPERQPSTLQSLQPPSHLRHHLLRVQVFLDRGLRRLVHRNSRRLYFVLQNLAQDLINL